MRNTSVTMASLSNHTVMANDTSGSAEFLGEAASSKIARWTLLILILLLGVVGNTAVCFIAYRNKRMRSFAYSLITNLAVADMLLAVVGIPIYVINDYQQTWTMGIVVCKVFKPSLTLFNIVITNTLVAIACDRFRGLVFPLSVKPGTTKTRLVLVLIWLIAFLCTLPSFGAIFLKTYEGYDVKVCTEKFHEDEATHRLYSKVYATFLFLINNLLPLLIILLLYVKITASLKRINLLPTMRILRRNSSDASTPSVTPRHSWNIANVNQVSSNRRQLMEKKFIRMLMVVVLVFLVCYVPYQILFFVLEYHQEPLLNPEPFMYYLLPYLYVLMWVPVALNPVCYGSMNERYKRAFGALMRCNQGSKMVNLRRRLSSLPTLMSPVPQHK